MDYNLHLPNKNTTSGFAPSHCFKWFTQIGTLMLAWKERIGEIQVPFLPLSSHCDGSKFKSKYTVATGVYRTPSWERAATPTVSLLYPKAP